MNAANFRSVPNENNSSKGETRESRTMNIISTFNSGSWQQVGNVMRSVFGVFALHRLPLHCPKHWFI
jgi:hypothetical protein